MSEKKKTARSIWAKFLGVISSLGVVGFLVSGQLQDRGVDPAMASQIGRAIEQQVDQAAERAAEKAE